MKKDTGFFILLEIEKKVNKVWQGKIVWKEIHSENQSSISFGPVTLKQADFTGYLTNPRALHKEIRFSGTTYSYLLILFKHFEGV